MVREEESQGAMRSSVAPKRRGGGGRRVREVGGGVERARREWSWSRWLESGGGVSDYSERGCPVGHSGKFGGEALRN
jgi:hypothetical protein